MGSGVEHIDFNLSYSFCTTARVSSCVLGVFTSFHWWSHIGAYNKYVLTIGFEYTGLVVIDDNVAVMGARAGREQLKT